MIISEMQGKLATWSSADKERKFDRLLRMIANRSWLQEAARVTLASRGAKTAGIDGMSKTRDAELIVRTFRKAQRRYPEARPKIFHSDRGIEYANYKIGRMLEKQSIEQSMSGKGNCYDNAHMESFFHTYKSEMYYTEKFDDLEDFKMKTKQYLRFYNKKRLHSSLGYMSPADYAKSKV